MTEPTRLCDILQDVADELERIANGQQAEG